MQNRFDLSKVEPEGYKVMMAFEKYVHGTKLTPIQRELIKIRASQINGCAFCLDMHTKDARKLGETEQRIYTLGAWRDAPYYTEEERAILSLVEEITEISKGHVKEETYAAAAKVLDEQVIAQVIMATIVINGWNRIAITTGLQPA
jgi:AhpD family alkylhydroperoxidase